MKKGLLIFIYTICITLVSLMSIGCSAVKRVTPKEPVQTGLETIDLETANLSLENNTDEVQPKTTVQSEESAKTESASEPKPSSEQETKITQTSPAKEIKYTDIFHIFKPYEQNVEISFQMPEDWEYTAWDITEESPDWGYSIKVQGRDDANFRIFGQFGTLTADDYSNGPEAFQTSQELTGQYFWDEYMLDDGNPAIQGTIVFDTELSGFYGISFNMPKSVYSENKDIINDVFQSIVIREAQ